jgi:hypothetical protein
MDYQTELTEEQKNAFAAVNARLGLGPTEYTARLSENELSSLPATRIMSSSADESHFPPHYIAVGSIAEMRKIAGFSEEYVDSGQEEPDYPDPPSQDEMHLAEGYSANISSKLSDDLRNRIRRAAEAYVVGNPAKVKGYESLINATLFPGRIAVFTDGILEVPANTTHIIKGPDPVILNYEAIIVGENATISVQSGAEITTQIFIQQQ